MKIDNSFGEMISLIDYNYKNANFVREVLGKRIEDILKPFIYDEGYLSYNLGRYYFSFSLYNKDCDFFILTYRTGNFYSTNNFSIDLIANVTNKDAKNIKETLDKFFGIEGKLIVKIRK